MKSLINKILASFGYIMVKKNLWRPKKQSEKLELPVEIELLIKSNSMLNEYRLINIIDCIKYVSENKVEGDLVECGVWKGGGVALMAFQLKTLQDFRTLHLFDAFDDICQPDAAVDGDRALKDVGGAENAKGELTPITGVYNAFGGAGNDTVVFNLVSEKIGYAKDKIKMHKGWFQDTLPIDAKEIEKISILRLDGDWYASTKVCLDYLYEKVVKGGIIIVDDYGCYDGCKKAVDEFIYNNEIKAFINKVDDECIFWVKQ